MELFLNRDGLYLSSNEPDFTPQCLFTLPSNVWTFLTFVTQKYQGDKVAVGLFLETDLVYCIDVPVIPLDLEGTMTLKLGGEGQGQKPFGFIGSFALSSARLDENQLAKVIQGQPHFEELPNFIIRTSSQGLEVRDPDIKSELAPPVNDGTSLYSVMSEYDYVASFLPLFANLSQAPENLPRVVLGIMQQLPDWDPGYFSIIRQYLMAFSGDHLSYSLYIGLFSLFSVFPDDILFDNLILVTDLWSQSSPDCFQRIIRHWSAIRMNTCSSIFQRPLFFTRLLKLFQTLFVDKTTRLDRCRHAFVSLLEEVGKVNCMTQDVGYLFHVAFTATHPRLIVDCLQLVRHLSAQVSSVPDIVDFLHVFVPSRIIHVAVAAIRAIYTLAPRQLLARMCAISYQLSNKAAIFEVLLEQLPRYIGFIHLLAILAMDLDDSAKQKFINMLSAVEMSESSADFLGHRFWFLWLFLLATQLNSEALPKLMLFIAKGIRLTSDFQACLDVFVDMVQILESVIDFNASVLMLELFVAINAQSLGYSDILLNHCLRLLFFRFSSCVRNSTLLFAMKDSPFPADSCWSRKPPRLLTSHDAVLRVIDQDFSGHRLLYGLGSDPESVALLQFCLPSAPDVRSPLDRHDLQLAYVRGWARKRWHTVEDSRAVFDLLNKGVPELQFAFELAFSSRTTQCLSQLKAVLREIEAAAFINLEKTEKTVVEFAAAVQCVKTLPDRPCSETVDRYLTHLRRSVSPSSQRVISRCACRSFIPFKMTFLEDLTNHRLFMIDYKHDPNAQLIGFVTAATLWEFDKRKTVLVVIDDTAVEISRSRKVLGRFAFGDLITLEHRKDECIELFTTKFGSFYLDFAPASHLTIMAKISASEWKPNDSLLFAKRLTNFDYLMLLNLMAHKTFHVFHDQPMMPLPPDFTKEVPAIDYCVPEFAQQSLSHVYGVRRVLERVSIDEYAKNKFGDLAVARVAETTTSLIWHDALERLEIEADEEIETGDFCHGEMVYLKMKSGRLSVHGIFDRFCAIAQPQLDGPVVLVGSKLLVYDNSSGIELLNLVGGKFSTVLRSKFALDFLRVVGRKILFVADYCLVCAAIIEQPSKYSTVVTSSSRICAFDVSGNSNTIAVGTEECLVNMYSLSNRELNGVAGLNSLEPEKVLVTPSWALIIILTHSEVLVYLVNGTFVDKMTTEKGIRDWKAFTNDGGFDYVAFIDDGSRIGIFEAMKLNDVQYVTFPAFRYNLVAVGYLSERRAVAGLTKDGDLTLTPLETG
jgi:hypothetical protein